MELYFIRWEMRNGKRKKTKRVQGEEREKYQKRIPLEVVDREVLLKNVGK